MIQTMLTMLMGQAILAVTLLYAMCHACESEIPSLETWCTDGQAWGATTGAYYEANGHCYQVVETAVNWDDALAACVASAAAAPQPSWARLAHVTSAEIETFILSNPPAATRAVWLGARYSGTGAKSDPANWNWVNGPGNTGIVESISFTPGTNNPDLGWAGQLCGYMWSNGNSFNDHTCSDIWDTYACEYIPGSKPPN